MRKQAGRLIACFASLSQISHFWTLLGAFIRATITILFLAPIKQFFEKIVSSLHVFENHARKNYVLWWLRAFKPLVQPIRSRESIYAQDQWWGEEFRFRPGRFWRSG